MLCTGTNSEMAHMWAQWLPNPCRLGGPQCSAWGQNQKLPTCGHCGYLTPAVSVSRGSPTLQSKGQSQKWPSKGRIGFETFAVLGVLQSFKAGENPQEAENWADWLHKPYRLRGPQHFGEGEQNQKRPTNGQIDYITPTVEGSPALLGGVQSQKWPTNGQIGHITLALLGVTNTLQQGTKSEVAHERADWLQTPCLVSGPQSFTTGAGAGSGPQVGRLLRNPCRLGGSQRFTAWDIISIGQQVGELAT